MFDWIPNLYATLTLDGLLLFFGGTAVGIPVGIWIWQRHIARQEARQLAKDIEARIAQCPDEVEVDEDVAYRILHLVFDGKKDL